MSFVTFNNDFVRTISVVFKTTHFFTESSVTFSSPKLVQTWIHHVTHDPEMLVQTSVYHTPHIPYSEKIAVSRANFGTLG